MCNQSIIKVHLSLIKVHLSHINVHQSIINVHQSMIKVHLSLIKVYPSLTVEELVCLLFKFGKLERRVSMMSVTVLNCKTLKFTDHNLHDFDPENN